MPNNIATVKEIIEYHRDKEQEYKDLVDSCIRVNAEYYKQQRDFHRQAADTIEILNEK